MRYLKRVLTAVLCIMLITSSISVLAAETKTSTKTIYLSDAVKTALENNSNIKNLNEKINLAQRRYKYASDQSLYAESKYGNTYEEHVESKKQQYLYPMQRKFELDELIWQKSEAERNLKVNVTKLYYQIYNKIEQITLQEKVIQSLNDEYSVKKKQAEAGIIAESALLTLEIRLDEEEFRLSSYKNDLQILIMDMNKLLGYDIDQKLNVKSIEIPQPDLPDIDIDELVEQAVSQAHSVKKLEAEKAIKEKEYWIVSTFSEKPSNADSIAEQLIDYDYDLRDEKVAVDYKIRSEYNNILNLRDEITIKKLDLDKSDRFLSITRTKVNLGMQTALDLSNAQIERDTAFYNYRKALLDYYIAVLNFNTYLESMGVTIS